MNGIIKFAIGSMQYFFGNVVVLLGPSIIMCSALSNFVNLDFSTFMEYIEFVLSIDVAAAFISLVVYNIILSAKAN